MATPHFGVGLELGHDFGSNGRVAAYPLVETDPGALFLEFDAVAP
jgi:hypothetical protein